MSTNLIQPFKKLQYGYNYKLEQGIYRGLTLGEVGSFDIDYVKWFASDNEVTDSIRKEIKMRMDSETLRSPEYLNQFKEHDVPDWMCYGINSRKET